VVVIEGSGRSLLIMLKGGDNSRRRRGTDSECERRGEESGGGKGREKARENEVTGLLTFSCCGNSSLSLL
jgi:hypothetical protein